MHAGVRCYAKRDQVHFGVVSLATPKFFMVNFTPTGASWLNLVEFWFPALTEKQILRGVQRWTRELEQAICRYIEISNHHAKPFVWSKTADEILASVVGSYKRITDSVH